jgi:hypothetical protein
VPVAWPGESGAPLEPDEALNQLKTLWPKIKPYIPEKGQRAIDAHGVSEVDDDGDLVTTLVEGRGECAFTVFDEKGIALCGVEKAWKDGAIPFRKPISCHLYPIRVVKLNEHDGLNYHKWPICKPACACGEVGCARVPFPEGRFDPCVRCRRGMPSWRRSTRCGWRTGVGSDRRATSSAVRWTMVRASFR